MWKTDKCFLGYAVIQAMSGQRAARQKVRQARCHSATEALLSEIVNMFFAVYR